MVLPPEGHPQANGHVLTHPHPSRGKVVVMASSESAPRFLQLADVAEVLNTTSAQVYALVRRGDLPAIKIGGRGQWRVEASELEKYIERMYAEAKEYVAQHPFTEG